MEIASWSQHDKESKEEEHHMLKKIHSLFFPKPPEAAEQKIKILLMHQNLNLSAEQKQSLIMQLNQVVQSFVQEEILHEAAPLVLIDSQKKEA